jgi:hypothetical protein
VRGSSLGPSKGCIHRAVHLGQPGAPIEIKDYDALDFCIRYGLRFNRRASGPVRSCFRGEGARHDARARKEGAYRAPPSRVSDATPFKNSAQPSGSGAGEHAYAQRRCKRSGLRCCAPRSARRGASARCGWRASSRALRRGSSAPTRASRVSHRPRTTQGYCNIAI